MLRWFQAIMPKEDRFFDLFERHARTVEVGAEELRKLLNGGELVPEHCRKIGVYEHEADELTREVLQAVRRSFITPFDRSDIQSLIGSLDDAIDQMNKTAKTITLFEMTSFDEQMREMGDIIVRASQLTVEAMPLLRSVGTNAGRLNTLTEQIVRIEGHADDIHDDGLKAIFRDHGQADAMGFIVRREVYSHLEKVVDRFEDVANEINSLVVEHI